MKFLIIFLIFNCFLISGCRNTDKVAVSVTKEDIKNEDTDEYYDLAMDYLYGENGKSQDDSQALHWFKKAADMGDASAQNNLAILYAVGRGTKKDTLKAEEYFRMAADQNHPNGLVQTAKILLARDGSKNTEQQALALLEKAVLLDSNDALVVLSELYFSKNTSEDDKKAVFYLEKSASLGDKKSMKILSNFYKKNNLNSEAEKWLNLANQ